jgi:hypothetical protein
MVGSRTARHTTNKIARIAGRTTGSWRGLVTTPMDHGKLCTRSTTARATTADRPVHFARRERQSAVACVRHPSFAVVVAVPASPRGAVGPARATPAAGARLGDVGAGDSCPGGWLSSCSGGGRVHRCRPGILSGNQQPHATGREPHCEALGWAHGRLFHGQPWALDCVGGRPRQAILRSGKQIQQRQGGWGWAGRERWPARQLS